jgi:hypothetical protein
VVVAENEVVKDVTYGDPPFTTATPEISLPPDGASYQWWNETLPDGLVADSNNALVPQVDVLLVVEGAGGTVSTVTLISLEVAELGVAHTPPKRLTEHFMTSPFESDVELKDELLVPPGAPFMYHW